jgi:hypothetical protein
MLDTKDQKSRSSVNCQRKLQASKCQLSKKLLQLLIKYELLFNGTLLIAALALAFPPPDNCHLTIAPPPIITAGVTAYSIATPLHPADSPLLPLVGWWLFWKGGSNNADNVGANNGGGHLPAA